MIGLHKSSRKSSYGNNYFERVTLYIATKKTKSILLYALL